MSRVQRVTLASFSMFLCFAISWVPFSKWAPTTDLKAYALMAIAMLLAASASIVLKPIYRPVGIRVFNIICICVAAFWCFDLVGGLIWFGLDKVARHIEQR
jgi:hypothetical protein